MAISKLDTPFGRPGIPVLTSHSIPPTFEGTLIRSSRASDQDKDQSHERDRRTEHVWPPEWSLYPNENLLSAKVRAV